MVYIVKEGTRFNIYRKMWISLRLKEGAFVYIKVTAV